MSVKVNLFPWLSDICRGQEEISVPGNSIGECLEHLNDMFPGIIKRLLDSGGKVKPYISIFLNGKNTFPEELSKPVKNGDVISIVLIIDGG